MRNCQKPAALALLLACTPLFAAASASPPPIAPGSPQAASLEFMKAMLSGDDKAAMATLYISSDKTRKDADAMIGQAAGEVQVNQAIAKIPGAKPAPDDIAAMVEAIGQSIAAAKVTITGEKAEVNCSPGPTLFLVRDAGRWKIDFARTQTANDGDNRQEIDQATADAAVYRSMLADLKAGKFKTETEARDELAKRKTATPTADDDAKIKETQKTLANVKTALQAFEVQFDRIPTTTEGLNALVEAPPALPTWDHQFMTKLPVDAWGRPLIYHSDGNAKFDISSAGPDGKEGTADDVKPGG